MAIGKKTPSAQWQRTYRRGSSSKPRQLHAGVNIPLRRQFRHSSFCDVDYFNTREMSCCALALVPIHHVSHEPAPFR
jgi:hypothetical protein